VPARTAPAGSQTDQAEKTMKFTSITIALAATIAAGSAARAQNAVALVGDDTLAIVDVARMKVGRTVKVAGLSGKILGIDVRPADGLLYALAADGTIVTIDPMSGKASMKSKLEVMLPAGVMATVDFNPVADRLRVIGSDGTNLRANVDDGKVVKDGSLKFADADANKAKQPKIVAGAYTNSMKGAKETALYDIDATGALVKQAPPNDGILNTLGMLGTKAEAVAFDIVAGEEMNAGWLMAGDTLYRVDLATGKATLVGKIAGVSGTVRDIAALPKAM
jgi:hypothetical protein